MPYTKEVFRNRGIGYQWFDFPGGTGAMSEALREKEIDIAIMLTEGAIAAIAGGEPFNIRLPFVMSPLIWGVFVNANNNKQTLPSLWPAFVFVTRINELLDFTPIFEALAETVINFYSGDIMDWKKPLANNFHLSEVNSEHWLKRIKYYDGNRYWPDRIAAAAIIMKENSMIKHVPAINTLIVT